MEPESDLVLESSTFASSDAGNQIWHIYSRTRSDPRPPCVKLCTHDVCATLAGDVAVYPDYAYVFACTQLAHGHFGRYVAVIFNKKSNQFNVLTESMTS